MASNSLATNYSALSTATNVTAIAFLNAGDNTIITGTTSGQYVILPLKPRNGTVNTICNYSTQTWQVGITSPDVISNNGTAGNVFLAPRDTFTLTYASGTWYVTSTDRTSLPVLNVVDFGADSTGTFDSSTAIQNAINALPALGGIVFFPSIPGGANYKLGTGLIIGNGGPVAPSTRSGVWLMGQGVSSPGYNLNSNFTPPVTITITASVAAVTIRGPLAGWRITDIDFEGSGIVGSIGLKTISVANGEVKNCTFNNFQYGNYMTTEPGEALPTVTINTAGSTTYTYFIQPVGTGGYLGKWGGGKAITTSAATPNNTISWSAVTGAIGYNVARVPGNYGGSFIPLTTNSSYLIGGGYTVLTGTTVNDTTLGTLTYTPVNGTLNGNTHNYFQQISMYVPNLSASSVQTYGMYIDSGNQYEDTYNNTFMNIFINPATTATTTYPTNAIYLKGADNNYFNGVHLTASSTQPAATVGASTMFWITYDFTGSVANANGQPYWPSDNAIQHINFGSSAAGGIRTLGTSGYLGTTQSINRIYDVQSSSGNPPDPQIQSLQYGSIGTVPKIITVATPTTNVGFQVTAMSNAILFINPSAATTYTVTYSPDNVTYTTVKASSSSAVGTLQSLYVPAAWWVKITSGTMANLVFTAITC